MAMNRIWVCLVLVPVFSGGSPCRGWQDNVTSKVSPRREAAESSGREWEIVFPEGISTEEYARQLDFFDVDIAAVSKNGRIEYISSVSQYKPEKRQGRVESEYRLQIGWKSGELRAADRRLLRKAGIGSRGKELQHFFPRDVVEQMAKLEVDYAGRKREEIHRTRFKIRPLDDEGGYEFVVVEQDPPRPSDGEPAATESFEASNQR